MRISDWSSDVCSSDLVEEDVHQQRHVVLFEGIEQKRQRHPVFFERHIVLEQSRAHSIHDIADHCVYTSFVCHLPILPGDPFLFSGTDLLQHLSPLGWQHLNLTGDSLWTDPVAPSSAPRPIRRASVRERVGLYVWN